MKKSKNSPYSTPNSNLMIKKSLQQRRSSEENDESNDEHSEEPLIKKVLQLPDSSSMPAAFNKLMTGLGQKSQSFTGPLAEPNLDFPYRNLLRQKWLLSAQPRRLSQVRLFKKKRGQNELPQKSFMPRFKDLQPMKMNKKSFLYLFKLLEPNGMLPNDKFAKFAYETIPSETRELPYPKCYLNNISCWRR